MEYRDLTDDELMALPLSEKQAIDDIPTLERLVRLTKAELERVREQNALAPGSA